MKHFLTYIFLLASIAIFAQDNTEDKTLIKQKLEAQGFTAQANDLANNDDFVAAEMEYRKALSLQPKQAAGAYNLGTQYFKKGDFDEALYRHQQAAKNATSKEEKHKAFHNIGNILMEEKKCKEAVEAYKSALRNNPSDDETRYNFALAKECAKQQEDDKPQEDDKDGENNKDKDQNKDEDQKENNEKEQEDKNKEDQGEQDKKEGDQDKDEDGNPKDDQQNDPKEGDQKNEQNQPQPGQMSPQQIKNLLEAMNNQEQKVQEKINAEKVKGVKQQTDKDW